MEAKSILKAFDKCLFNHNLNVMTKDLYEFFHLRCGFIAHYDINGFGATYESPEDFLEFCHHLKEELENDIKQAEWHSNYTDNTDSFKYNYNFKIPEVKKAMLELLKRHTKTILEDCNNKILGNLIEERETINKKISDRELLNKQISVMGG